MRSSWSGKTSRRQRRTWLALWSTMIGTVALTGLVLWLATHRETDLVDPTAGITADFMEAGDVAAPPLRFRDVAREIGVMMRHGPGARGRTLPEDTGSGLAWADYDGDGDWDLYAVSFPGALRQSSNPAGLNRLFQNDGGAFTDVTESAGVSDLDGFGMGATFADFDADGDPDLYVTNFGPNRLFRNQGDGTFVEIGRQAGVADPRWSTGATWGDFDRDGQLDLYVCNYVDYDDSGVSPEMLSQAASGASTIPFTLNPNSFDPEPNRLYRNLGDGSFADVAESYGVDNPRGRSLAATLCDLDGDGWLDLYVNNDVSPNKLFRNMLGDVDGAELVPFVDLSAITGTADPRGSMGLSVGEIGGMSGAPDGLPDLFITHWIAQENALYQSVVTSGGDLEYRDKTRQFRLGEVSIDRVGWGSALTDLDLDGRLDLVVVNGSTLEQDNDPLRLVAEPIFLFWNDGNRFHDLAATAGTALARPHCARGLAVADFDGDGDVDLAVSTNRGQPLILSNETETRHTGLKVMLAGRPSACFGAKVEVLTGNNLQVRWWGCDVTFLGMHAPELIYGLGDAAAGAPVADRIHVRWADGKETTLINVPAGEVEILHPDAGTQSPDAGDTDSTG